ncbi:MAG: hypothetical protein JNK58_13610 [Phycisphaerae bacterium]|nr:hypothetical protein [Phycisphaerae bacterium]
MVRIAIASIVAAFACGSAFAADTVEMKKIDTGLGKEIKIIHGSDSFNAFAGEIVHQFTNGVGLGAQFNGKTMSTYCVEVTQTVTTNYRVYNVTDNVGTIPVPAMGADRAGAINSMFAMLLDKRAEGVFNNDWAAAFQIAVWDVVYDYNAGVGRDSLSVDAGDMKVKKTDGTTLSSSLRAKIDTYFDAIGVASSPFNIIGFHNDSYQDQIVPTPGTIALGSLGLLLVGRRRKG